jgi:hypothetical protein
MNRPFGRYGAEQSWSEWATTTSWLPNAGMAILPGVGPLYAAKWAYDRSADALAAGKALRAQVAPTSMTPAPTGLTPEATTLLERRLADYQTTPFQEQNDTTPTWIYGAGGAVLALMGLATLRALLAPGGAPTRRRRR